LLVQTFSVIMAKETFCPPPVKRFLRINNKIYRQMNGATLQLKGEPQEQVVRLSLRENPYYSSPKCGLLETDSGKGFTYFGIREEYDLQNFQSSGECEVYVARSGLETMRSVSVSVMLVTSLVSGVNTECQPQVSTRLSLTVNLCAEDEQCDDDEEEDDTEDDGDYEAEYVTNCESEWGCESVPDDCGEWGCVTESGYDARTDDDDDDTTQAVDSEMNMNDDEDDDHDVVAVIYSTLMSDTMTPVTITVLIILGVILLCCMYCLMCRGRNNILCCERSKLPDSSSSSLRTVGSDRIISGPFTMSTRDSSFSQFSRDHSYTTQDTSARSSTRSLQSQACQQENNYENILPKNISSVKPTFPLKRNLFILSEEEVKKDDSLVVEDEKQGQPKTKPKAASSQNTDDEAVEFQSFDMLDQVHTNIKLPAVVANSYKKAQKDIPVTFY